MLYTSASVLEVCGMRNVLFVVAATLLSVVGSEAGLITVSDWQFQTVSGQDFVFTFSGLAPSDGTGGKFILEGHGDFGESPFETIEEWYIDGGLVSLADFGGIGPGGFLDDRDGYLDGDQTLPLTSPGGPYDFVDHHGLDDYRFVRTYNLSPGQLSAILADGDVTVFAGMSEFVQVFPDLAGDVRVTLTYDVAEPETLLLLVVGLFLLSYGHTHASGTVRRH
jgi:hypothetical protein